MRKPAVLGITLGDAGGVGPESTLKAIHEGRWPASLRFVIIGSHAVVKQTARALGLPCPKQWRPDRPFPSAQSVVWDPGTTGSFKAVPGRSLTGAARAAAEWIRSAAGACMDGTLAGMVTAPICKEGFSRAGVGYPGHTEFIADLTGVDDCTMMLMGGGLRVALATRHIPFADVTRNLTSQAIVNTGRMTIAALPWFGLPESTIGICGLNPHAGDGGTIGTEEKSIIIPAIKTLRRQKAAVEGPIPADTAFFHARKGRYGAVIAMYHDQGLGPLKTVSFDTGINITLGLPIIRTSPDHGTAFDIAGQGIADPRSMINAIRLAYNLTRRPNPYKS